MAASDRPGRIFLAPGPNYVEPEPVICGPCQEGRHGDSCAGSLAGPPADGEDWDDCGCTEGACRGEWVDIGMVTEALGIGGPIS